MTFEARSRLGTARSPDLREVDSRARARRYVQDVRLPGALDHAEPVLGWRRLNGAGQVASDHHEAATESLVPSHSIDLNPERRSRGADKKRDCVAAEHAGRRCVSLDLAIGGVSIREAPVPRSRSSPRRLWAVAS